MARLCWLLVLLLIGAPAAAQTPLDEAPAPSEHDSHKAYYELLDKARDKTALDILARFDAAVAAQPQNVVAAMERCQFLLAASGDEDGEYVELLQEQAGSCMDELGERFPFEPKVLLLRARNSWGEQRREVVQIALNSDRVVLTPSDRGRLHELMAELSSAQGELADAAQEARLARELLPSVDVALILAKYEQSRGKKAMAVKELVYRLDATKESHQLFQKAQRLAELEAYEGAQRALDLYDERAQGYRDHELRGRILEGLGRAREARDEYQQSSKHSRVVPRRQFELELAHGDAKQAAAAYQALRDGGYEKDPLLRNRLRLFFAHPALPFRLRDVGGLLSLIALLIGVWLLPLVVLVPIHYRGLVLRARSGQALPSDGYRLHDAWRLAALILSGDVLVTLIFGGDLIHEWVGMANESTLDRAQLARLALAFGATRLLLTVGFFKRAGLLRWFRAGEPNGARKVLRALLIAGGVAALNGVLSKALDLDASEPAAWVTTRELLVAVLDVTGAWGLLFVVAICAPVAEELLFRGVLLEAFERHVSSRAAQLTQATLFMLMHDAWTMWPTLFTIGLLSGRLRRQTGSLRASLLMHMAWNTLIAVVMIIAHRAGMVLAR